MDLVVMGGGWYSGGREFDSQHCILDGHFFTFVCLKRLINKKEPGYGPFSYLIQI